MTIEGECFRGAEHKQEYLQGLDLETLPFKGNEQYYSARKYIDRVGEARVRHERNRESIAQTNATIRYIDQTFRRMESITAENVDQVEHQDVLWRYLEDHDDVFGYAEAPEVESYLVKQENKQAFEEDCRLVRAIDNTMFDARIVEQEVALRNIERAHEIREAYIVRSNLFLNKYMPQVLYDLGFFAERA